MLTPEERMRFDKIVSYLKSRVPFTAESGRKIVKHEIRRNLLVTTFSDGKELETPAEGILHCDKLAPIIRE